MARRPESGGGKETTPQQFPEVTPPVYPETIGVAYLVESMMQMQNTLGELKHSVKILSDQSTNHGEQLSRIATVVETVRHLSGTSEEHGKKIAHFGNIVFAGKVVAILIGVPLLGSAGFFLTKYWDSILRALGAPHTG